MLITPTNAISSEEAKLKELPLEARHSICLEIAKKKRLKVPTSIFIPKEFSRKLRFLRMPQQQESSADLVISKKLSKESIRKKLLSSGVTSISNFSNISINSVKNNSNSSSSSTNNSSTSNSNSDKNTMLQHPESFPIVRQTVTSDKIRCVVEKLRDRNEDEEFDITGTAAPAGVAACNERAPVCMDMPNLEQICYSEEQQNHGNSMNNNCLSLKSNNNRTYGQSIDTACIQCDPCRNDDEEMSFYGQQQYPQYSGNQKDCIKTENYYADDCNDDSDGDGNVIGDNGRVGCLQPCGSDGVENYGYLEPMITKSFKDDCNCMPMNENINDIVAKKTQDHRNYSVNVTEQNYYAEYSRERNSEQLKNNCKPAPMSALYVSPPAPLSSPAKPLCSPVAAPPPPSQSPSQPLHSISDYLNFANQQQQQRREAASALSVTQQQQQQRDAAIASYAAQQQREALMNCAAQQQRQTLMNCPPPPPPCEPITPQPKDIINCVSFLCPPPPPPNCNDDELPRIPIYSVASSNRLPHNFNINCNSLHPGMPCDQHSKSQSLLSAAPPPSTFAHRFLSTSSAGTSIPNPYYFVQQQQQDDQRQQTFLMPTLTKPQAQILQELKQQHLQQQLQLQQIQQSQLQSPSQSRNYNNRSFERPCWHARDASTRTRKPATSPMYNSASYRPCTPCTVRRAQRLSYYQAAQQHPQQQQQLQQSCDVHSCFLESIGGSFKSETSPPATPRQQQQQRRHPRSGHCCSNHLMHSNSSSLHGIGMCQGDMQFSHFPHYPLYTDYRDTPYTAYNPYAPANMQHLSSVPACNVGSSIWHPYHVTPQTSEHFFQR